MELDNPTEVIENNSDIDRTAIDRSRHAAKQLADVGVVLGGYRLMPALGSRIINYSDNPVTQSLVPRQE